MMLKIQLWNVTGILYILTCNIFDQISEDLKKKKKVKIKCCVFVKFIPVTHFCVS